MKDHRNVSVMIDLLELVKRDASQEQNIYEMLGRIIEITEAQQGILFEAKSGAVVRSYARRTFQDMWIERPIYNSSIVESVLKSQKGFCDIDWDEIVEYDLITGMPDWKSVVAVPMVKNGETRGVIYLSVSTKIKEFKLEDFNFISTMGQISVALL